MSPKKVFGAVLFSLPLLFIAGMGYYVGGWPAVGVFVALLAVLALSHWGATILDDN